MISNRACQAVILILLVVCLTLLLFTRGDTRRLALGRATPFSIERMQRDLDAILALGSRPMGSAAGKKAAAYIQQELETLGLLVHVQGFTAALPPGFTDENAGQPESRIQVQGGHVQGRNLWAALPSEGRYAPCGVILSGHYDTKNIRNFIGAVDGASSTVLLLELARVLRENPFHTLPVFILFFDGEEAFTRFWAPFGRQIGGAWVQDALYGSRHFVDQIQDFARANPAIQPAMLLNLDMLGDGNLRIKQETSTTPRLRGLILDELRRLESEYKRLFTSNVLSSIEDDHTPFFKLYAGNKGRFATFEEIGELIDINYPYWHTPRDTRVYLDETALAGELVLRVLRRVSEPGFFSCSP